MLVPERARRALVLCSRVTNHELLVVLALLLIEVVLDLEGALTQEGAVGVSDVMLLAVSQLIT